MFFVFSLIFAYSPFLAVFVSAALPASTMDDIQDKIVALHNKIRNTAEPPPAQMKQLQWHDGLARMAQAWSNKCLWKHGQPREKKTTIGPDGKPFGNALIGQNLGGSRESKRNIACIVFFYPRPKYIPTKDDHLTNRISDRMAD